MMLILIVQSAVKTAVSEFWPVSLAAILSSILTGLTIYRTVRADYNKSLEEKFAPLYEMLRGHKTDVEREVKRLQDHFDYLIQETDHEITERMTNMANSLRQEMKQLGDRQMDISNKASKNEGRLEEHERAITESRMDRQTLHKDFNQMQMLLESLRSDNRNTEGTILNAIRHSEEKLAGITGDLGTRTTRVEEALKFYGRQLSGEK